ncbi:cryptochrome/photolyase family protein [Jatrophihabitans sp. YIM 134969]
MTDGGSVLWLRRDLRVRDHPALQQAAQDGPLTVLFVLDESLRRPSGAPRLAFLYRALRSLAAELESHGGRLTVRRGKPENVVPTVVAETGAHSVYVTGDFGPYGKARDERVEQALPDGVELVRVSSPYANAPGTVMKDDGELFKVYSPYYRAWRKHGWDPPTRMQLGRTTWADAVDSTDIPADPHLEVDELPEASEDAARKAWKAFLDDWLDDYDEQRNRPDKPATSRMSVYLKYGLVHPRTLLADLEGRQGVGAETYRKELAWREFYATVLHVFPESAREYYIPKMAKMPYATGKEADEHFEAWATGTTGYPIVDAGMRQLLATGWMHNRLRMITGSFLTKDLHIEWTRGARYFMQHLVDGDLASNNHGWQWVAGTGTDASPYFRVFNPVTQGEKFDPDGEYVRRWVPELRDVDGLAGKKIHRPWELADPPAGYPAQVVDHAAERAHALENYQKVKDL